MAGVQFLVIDNTTSTPIQGVYCHDDLGGGYTDINGYTDYFQRTAYVDTYWTFERTGYETLVGYWVQPASYDLTFSVRLIPLTAIPTLQLSVSPRNGQIGDTFMFTGVYSVNGTAQPLRSIRLFLDSEQVGSDTTDTLGQYQISWIADRAGTLPFHSEADYP